MPRRHALHIRFLYLLCACALTAASSAAHAQTTGWRPDKNIEIVAPATPGGLHDITARSLQQVFQTRKLVEVPVVVVNKGGGGGTVGWTYLNQQQGDPHFVSLIAVNMLSNHVMGTSSLHHADFTPLTDALSRVPSALRSKPDAPLATGKEMLARLSKDPSALSVAIGTSLGNTSHLALSLAVKSTGGEPRKLKTVVFGSNGEAMTALLGGHVDAIMTLLPNLVRALAGEDDPSRCRIVAAACRRRFFRCADLARAGCGRAHVRGGAASSRPAELTPTQVGYWENVFTRLNETDEWKQELAKNFWHVANLSSRETREFLDKEYQKFQQVLGELGMTKRK